MLDSHFLITDFHRNDVDNNMYNACMHIISSPRSRPFLWFVLGYAGIGARNSVDV